MYMVVLFSNILSNTAISDMNSSLVIVNRLILEIGKASSRREYIWEIYIQENFQAIVILGTVMVPVQSVLFLTQLTKRIAYSWDFGW